MLWPPSAPQQRFLNKICKHVGVRVPSIDEPDVYSALLHLGSRSIPASEEQKLQQASSEYKTPDAISLIAKTFGVQPPADSSEKNLADFLVLALNSWRPPDWHKVAAYWKAAVTYLNLSKLSNFESVDADFSSPEAWRAAPPQPRKLKVSRHYKSGSTEWWIIFGVEPRTKADRGQFKQIVFLAIPLAIDDDQQFIPPRDGMVPRLNRDWLEPPNPFAEKKRYLGSMDDLQKFLAEHPVGEDWDWPTYWSFVEQLVQTLTGETVEKIHHSAGEDSSDLVIDVVSYDGNKLSKRFVNCLDAALAGKAPLLRHLASPNRAPAPLLSSIGDLLPARQRHLGHMDTFDVKTQARNGFPLEESQRQAVNHMSCVQDDELLAVNGPPGTGKTSFLRGVIASEWIQGALDGTAGPVIIATAATNKAVTNIIESFAEIPGPEMSPVWSSRWLPGLPSYGWFFPAGSHTEERWKDYMTLKRPFVKGEGIKPLEMIGQASRFADTVATGTDALKSEFLRLHARCVGLANPLPSVADAVRNIQEELRGSVGIVQRVQAELATLIGNHAQRQEDFALEMKRQADMAAIGQELSAQQYHRDSLESDLVQRKAMLDRLMETWNAYLKERAAERRQKAVADAAERLREFFDASVAPAMSGSWWARFKSFLFGKKEERDQASALRHQIDCVGQFADPAPEPPKETIDLRGEIKTIGEEINKAKRALGILQGQLQALMKQLAPLAEHREKVTAFSVWLAELNPAPPQSLIDEIQGLKNMSPNIPGDILALRVEEWLDVSYRFRHFHMAARYWEARWLEIPLHSEVKNDAECEANLRHMAMLAPVVVATIFTAPTILYGVFRYAELLIFDEAGQASPELGCPAFAVAKRAIVVGDVDQLEPIWNLPPVDDKRLVREAELTELDLGFSAATGSVMAVAQRGTAFGPPAMHVKAGVSLKAHYRCRRGIIGYCQQLIYGDDLIPSRKERPEDKFPYPPMTWVAVEGSEPSRDGGSWRNDAQVKEIVGWLADDADRLKAHYGKDDLADIVALIAPFRAQALAIREAVSRHTALGEDLARRMVINTVHALQGAEKPVVAFTMTQNVAPFFVNGYGNPKPNLLNVAVSRAKDAFILFADPRALKPIDGEEGMKPLGVLVKYLSQNGQRLYPRELVFIESSQKKEHIVRALGRRAKVIATGGHFVEVAEWPKGAPPKWVAGDSSFMSELRESLKDAGQLDYFVLATDDDRDGEEIAWHILRTLHTENDGLAKRTVRMRFHALDADTLRLAREQAMPGVDVRRVQSSLLKRLADFRLQQKIEAATGTRIGRNQIVTLRWIAGYSSPAPLRFRVVVKGRIGEEPAIAYPVSNTSAGTISPWMTAEDAESLHRHLERVESAAFLEHQSELCEYPKFPPNTTDRVFISGWRRYGWRPSETAVNLQNTYWGRYSTNIRNGGES